MSSRAQTFVLATSAANIYAAGDFANAWHPFSGRHVRVEHWANALNQGPAAARAMVGHHVANDRIPCFFSDQYDLGMEYSGHATESDEVVFRGNPAARGSSPSGCLKGASSPG